MTDPLDAFRRQGEIDAAKPLPVPIDWRVRAEAAERERDEWREHHDRADHRAFAYAQENERLREALEPLALLELPKKPQGNAGLYSIFHKQILTARAALEAKP